MPSFTPRQFVLLVLLTLAWGLNWPVMKLGVADYPPLAFRALSIWLGVPVLGLALVVMKVPFRVPRSAWPELVWLGATNMFIWHACIILAVKALSGGRTAILGYTMPVFSAIIGAVLFSAVLTRRSWIGVGACAIGVGLLLWHELTDLAGRPGYVALALVAAATWALGTQLLRHTRIGLADRLAVFGEGNILGRMLEADCGQIAFVGRRPRRLARVAAPVAKQHRLELLAGLQPRLHGIHPRTTQIPDGLILFVGHVHRRQVARTRQRGQLERVAPIGLDTLRRLARNQ